MGYKYCPYCKEDIIFKSYSYTCKNNHLVYVNPSPTVNVLPIKDCKILFSRRAIEPRKGTIDILGGFVNVGETTREAAVREIFEETGLKIKIDKSIGEYHEIYAPEINYPLCFAYTASVISGELKPQDDVSELFWVDINDIKNLDLTGSFPTIKGMLEDLLKII
jgi:ADP-ribose pyrophosphatase YjhB (NUDIX family)